MEFSERKSLMEFLGKEAAFWKEKQESLDDASLAHRWFCYDILHDAILLIQNNNDLSDQSFTQVVVEKALQNLWRKWLWSEHPHIEEFVKYNKLYNKEVAEGFLCTVIAESEGGSPINTLRRWGSDEGAAMALAFLKNQEFESRFNIFMANSHDRFRKLGHIYEEKLRLEKPAEYWKKAGLRFKNQALGWSIVLFAALAVGIGLLAVFFLNWIKGQEIPVELDTVQGIVIFSTVLALYAFLIRILSRLAFSAFHLMRDAEEREQLTYLYLSLTNEKVTDEASRNLILQALFSRSQTGLLSGESGPSMPVTNEIKELSADKK